MAEVWRKHTDTTGKGHFCLGPDMELWAEMVRLWHCTSTIAHIYIHIQHRSVTRNYSLLLFAVRVSVKF